MEAQKIPNSQSTLKKKDDGRIKKKTDCTTNYTTGITTILQKHNNKTACCWPKRTWRPME